MARAGGPLEAEIQRSIQRLLKNRGAWVVKYHGGKFTVKGTPDLLCCYRGRFLAIEVKRPGNKPTKLQEEQMQRIRNAKGLAFSATSREDVEEVLDRIDKAHQKGR